MNGDVTRRIDAIGKRAFTVGVAAAAVSAVATIFEPSGFFHAYLLAFLFAIGLALGSMALLMLYHLVGGGWGFVIRRMLEAASRTVPLFAALALIILASAGRIYPWAGGAHEELGGKASYLNVPFFAARTAVYFAAWLTFAFFLNRSSREEDTHALRRRMQGLSGAGLVVYGLTVTFAAVDWVMSLEPHWFSTIYGMMFMVGQVLNTLAFAILLLKLLSDEEPLRGAVSASHFHDLGNLLLTFVMLWAYVSFAQFLIIWTGNLPEEIPWYLRRTSGGWQWIAVLLILFHFAVPFVLLLLRATKRRAAVLAAVAAAMMVMRLVDLFWVVEPAFHGGAFRVHLLDLTLPLAFAGVWLGLVCRELRKRPILPLGGPEVEPHAMREAHG
jgi:uncharacterized membrane protein YciS (DUF1049 family)